MSQRGVLELKKNRKNQNINKTINSLSVKDAILFVRHLPNPIAFCWFVRWLVRWLGVAVGIDLGMVVLGIQEGIQSKKDINKSKH